MTQPFISVDDLGTYIGQDLSASDLAVITTDAACQLIRDEIDQHINFVEDEEIVLMGRDRSLLILPEHPIVEVTEVIIDDGDALVEDTDFRIVNERGMLERLSAGAADDDTVWTKDTSIHITYSHGWVILESAVDPEMFMNRVPSSIRAIALALAATGMVAGRVGVGGIRSETLGRYRYDLDTTQSASSGMTLSEVQCDRLYKYRVEGTP